MTRRPLLLLALVATLARALVVTPLAFRRRCAPVQLCIPREAPPAPPPIRSDPGYGGGGDGDLVLQTMSPEERKATLALWKLYYEHEAERDEFGTHSSAEDAIAAGFVARWVGDMAPSGWFGTLTGKTLGAYIGDSLEGIAVIRYELDGSDWQRFLMGGHVLIVDEILLAPDVPEHFREIVHAGIVSRLIDLGHAHKMNVAFWEDFGI